MVAPALGVDRPGYLAVSADKPDLVALVLCERYRWLVSVGVVPSS